MHLSLTEIELRDLCKRNIESFELWSRRLINERMIEIHGMGYLHKQHADGNMLIKKSLLDSISQRKQGNPKRYSRDIDAILFDDICYFLCREDF